MKNCKNRKCGAGLKYDPAAKYCPACNRLADRIMALPDIENRILPDPALDAEMGGYDVRNDPMGFSADEYGIEPELISE